MNTMSVLMIAAAILLVFGPLRKPYLHAARFTIPATLGGIGGFLLGVHIVSSFSVAPPLSRFMPLMMAIGVGMGLGEGVKAWCDQTFGDGRGERHG